MTSATPVEPVQAVPVRKFHASAANLVALASIQMANALLPLVAFPLILSVVGAGPFARVVVTESVMMVVLALVIYSFDVEGVSSIAYLDSRTHRAEISAVFSEVLIVRLLILSACIAALVVISPFIDSTTFWLLASWALFPLAYILQSAWFFQGTERNVAPAVVIVASRILCVYLVRTLIVSPRDFYMAPLIIGASYALAGALLLCYATLAHGVRITPVSASRIRRVLFRGKEIFAGNLSVALYRGSNILILNAISTNRAVVIYSIAEKTIKVFQAGASPLNQVFFPKVIRALRHMTLPSPTAFRTVRRYTTPQLALLGSGAAVLLTAFAFWGGLLPAAFRSAQGKDILTLIAIMAPTVFWGVANFMFGTAGLNYLGRRTYFAKAILTTGICNLICCFILVRLFAATGAALSFVLAEMTLFAMIVRAYFGPDPVADQARAFGRQMRQR